MKNFFVKKKVKFFLKDTLKQEIKAGLTECGKYSYGNPTIHRWGNKSKIYFGNFCSLGPNIDIFMGADHRFDYVTTSPLGSESFNNAFPNAHKDFLLERGDLIIGHDVWIGANTKIFSGIEIGSGAIIGAGSVIRKNVEPYSIVYGNPAKEVSKRFDAQTIEKLLKIKWWFLDESKINLLSNSLLSNDIDNFFKEYDDIKE